MTKSLSANNSGDYIFPVFPDASSKNMGLLQAGLFSKDVGWASDEPQESVSDDDNTFNGITYLIHFLYNISGQTIDRYYPCAPQNLVWVYNSMSL